MSRNKKIEDGGNDGDDGGGVRDLEEAAIVENAGYLNEDLEALNRACMIVGVTPSGIEEVRNEYSAFQSAFVSREGDSYGGVDCSNSESEDDLELLKSIRSRFSKPEDLLEPLFMEAFSTPPSGYSSDADEDEFETLRAAQKLLLSTHSCGGSTPTVNETLENRTYSCIHADKSRTNAYEEFPESAKECQGIESRTNAYEGVPESAQVLIDAINKNRWYQRLLCSNLIQMEARITENNKLKERFGMLQEDLQPSDRNITRGALSQKKDILLLLISARKTGISNLKEVDDKELAPTCFGPMENCQVAHYRNAVTKYPLSFRRRKWSESEKENLAKEIRQQVLYSGNASIEEVEIKPQQIRQFLPRINWDKLASMYVVGRSGAECETQWLNWEDPLVNHNPWTSMEDKNLQFILEEKGITIWLAVAVSLGTNRTPFQCLERYQRSLNTCILKSKWSKDEDDQLRVAVGELGEKNWQTVASVLEGRTGSQCSNRWQKSLHPSRSRTGRWRPDEDKHLIVAVMLFGPKNWKKIAQFVPGRTQVQCRERWFNSLDPSLKQGNWTEEEESVLKAAFVEHGNSWIGGISWSKIAARLPSRTDNQCWRRWKTLFPLEVKFLQQARRMWKAATICNFVDRESERPALQSSDSSPYQH